MDTTYPRPDAGVAGGPAWPPVAPAPWSADGRSGILRRLRQVEGQVCGIQRMVEANRSCSDVLQQITAAEAAFDKVALALVAERGRHAVVGQASDDDAVLGELMAMAGRFLAQRQPAKSSRGPTTTAAGPQAQPRRRQENVPGEAASTSRP